MYGIRQILKLLHPYLWNSKVDNKVGVKEKVNIEKEKKIKQQVKPENKLTN